MILANAVLKILAILAVYGALVWTLERRCEARFAPYDGSRQSEPAGRGRARRHAGRVA